MEKRTLIAVILSMIVLLAYQAAVVKFHKEDKPATETVKSVSVSRDEEVVQEEFSVAPSYSEEDYSVSRAEEIIISSDNLSLYLSSQAAAVKKILLKEELFETKSRTFSLIEQEQVQFAPFALWFGSEPQQPDLLSYKVSDKEDRAEFSADINDDISLRKKLSFTNAKNGIELEIVIDNHSATNKTMVYSIVAASNIDRSNNMDKRFSGIEAKVNGTILWENLRALRKATGWIEHKGQTDWVAIRNTYYEVVLKPEIPAYASISRYVDRDNFACGLKTDKFVIPAKSSVSHKYLLYAGPSNYNYLSPHGLNDTIYFGKLNFICKFLIRALSSIHGVTRNYGLAIIILTLGLGIILFPLTKKNFRSMRQMQVIQPEITKLREMHKENPHKLQRETMELYRKHKVNPLGGCLPMFLQMPIFIALYLTLTRSFELKGANFLWIKDLSAPDAICPLPFKLPFLGEQVNLLPILMIAAMVIQQKISMYKRSKVDPQVEQQQKMMLMMPLLFGIIFYNLPSGLVLYWLTNTIFMTLVQFHIARAMPSVETVTG